MNELSMQDSYVSQAKATSKFGSANVLQTKTQTGNEMFALLKPAGALNRPGSASVASAKLRVYVAEGFSGSETFKVELVTKEFTPATVTWKNKPTWTNVGAVSVVKSNPVINQEIEFDVSSLLMSALGSGILFGFKISSTSSIIRKFFSVEAANVALRPKLLVNWKTAPDAPSFLNPSKMLAVSSPRPVFTFNYNDSSGLSAMSAYELQLDYSDSTFASPDYSSGLVVSNSPLHALTSDLTENDSFFWRVKVRNASQEWSEWSPVAQSIFISKESVDIDFPLATVGQLTPPILWTTSGIQSAFQILETDPVAPGIVRQDSFIQTGSDDSFTLAQPLNFQNGSTRIEVRVWDSVARTATPSDEAYSSDSVIIDFAPSGLIDPVNDLAAETVGDSPVVEIRWTYASVPDMFYVYRDSKFLMSIEAADAFISGTDFAVKDFSAGAGDHVWEIFPVVDDEASASSPTASATISGRFAWLIDPENPEFLVPFHGRSPLGEFAEQSEAITPAGASRTIVKSFALRGRESSFEGTFDLRAGYEPAVSLNVLETRLFDLKREPVKIWRLAVGRENFPVVLRNITWSEQPGSDANAFDISFEYFQQAELNW